MTATWFGFALIGDSWFQLLIAAALGILCTQLSFLAHEAGHRQIFASRRANDWAARLLATSVAGISYSWWEQKHGAHHNHPNVISKDPDIATGAIAFHPEAAATRQGRLSFLTRKQGWFFFPLLFLVGLGLQIDSIKFIFQRAKVTHRWVEIPILAGPAQPAAGARLHLPAAGAWRSRSSRSSSPSSASTWALPSPRTTRACRSCRRTAGWTSSAARS